MWRSDLNKNWSFRIYCHFKTIHQWSHLFRGSYSYSDILIGAMAQWVWSSNNVEYILYLHWQQLRCGGKSDRQGSWSGGFFFALSFTLPVYFLCTVMSSPSVCLGCDGHLWIASSPHSVFFILLTVFQLPTDHHCPNPASNTCIVFLLLASKCENLNLM